MAMWACLHILVYSSAQRVDLSFFLLSAGFRSVLVGSSLTFAGRARYPELVDRLLAWLDCALGGGVWGRCHTSAKR